MNRKEYVHSIWNLTKPKSFRQAKNTIVYDTDNDLGLTEGTLRVYYSQWKKSHGIQRRYRKSGDG